MRQPLLMVPLGEINPLVLPGEIKKTMKNKTSMLR